MRPAGRHVLRLAALLLLVGIGAGSAAAHGSDDSHDAGTSGVSSGTDPEQASGSDGEALLLDLKPTLLTPKERIEMRFSEPEGSTLPEGREFRSIRLIHDEDRLTMFSARAEVGPRADPLRFVFPEGAPYRLTVGSSQGSGIAVQYQFNVAPLAPERTAQVRGALLLVVVYVAGVLGGLGLRRMSRRRG